MMAAAQSLSEESYYTIQQKSTGRFVDAYGSTHDSAAVLRFVQHDDTQKWRFTPVPGDEDVYTIQQISNSRYLDAYQNNENENDYAIVTRPMQGNATQRWRLTPQGNDTYRIQQESSDRFMDAYDTSNHDFSLITRSQRDNDSQQWVIKPVELRGTYVIKHKTNSRFVDAYEDTDNDHAMVTRSRQKNATQRWVLKPLGNNTYTIAQKSSGRFIDAYQDGTSGHNFGLVTRNEQNNDTQKWIVTHVRNDTFTIRQKSNGRFVDAYMDDNNDFALVTREAQSDGSQEWEILPQLRGTYTIQQKSNDRYMDAYTDDEDDIDYRLVTRSSQGNDSQNWLFTPLGGDTYTIQHWSNGRFVDAYSNSGQDYRLVTRPLQTNDTQKWTLTYLGGDDYRIQQKSSGRFVDAYQNDNDNHELVTRAEQGNDTQEWKITPTNIPNAGVKYGPESHITGDGLTSVTDVVDKLMREHLRINKIPGATVAASHNGKLIISKGYGYSNVETETPMQPTSRTRIGSVSKIITTLGFMKLSEQTPWLSPDTNLYGQGGALSHPTYVDAISDQLQGEEPAPFNWYLGMKVNHLLSHTSGLKGSKGETVATALGIDECEVIPPMISTDQCVTYRHIHQYVLANTPLDKEPGTFKDYENHNMGTIGLVIHEISGQRYRDYITDNILNPLGLSNVIPEDGITTALDSEPHSLTHSGLSTSVLAVDPTTTGNAAGGWMATAQDMVRLMVATDKLPNQSDILSPASIDLMETSPYPDAIGAGHALGWTIACPNDGTTTPSCRLAHNGALGGGYAYIIKYQDGYTDDGINLGNINVAVLLNVKKRSGVEDLAKKIAKVIGTADIPPGYDLFPDSGNLAP